MAEPPQPPPAAMEAIEQQATEMLHRLDDEYLKLCKMESFLESNILLRLQKEEACLRNALSGSQVVAVTAKKSPQRPSQLVAAAVNEAGTTVGNNIKNGVPPITPSPPPPPPPIRLVNNNNSSSTTQRRIQTATSSTKRKPAVNFLETEKQKLARLEEALLLESSEEEDSSATSSNVQPKRCGMRNDNHQKDDDDNDDEKALLDLLSDDLE